MTYYNITLHFKINYYKMTENSFDRRAIMNDTNYQYGDGESLRNTSWSFIGVLIGLAMNFIAFIIFYFFHRREYLKQLSSKI